MCKYETSSDYEDFFTDTESSTKTETDACFKFNIGAGAEYSITDNISAGIELRYEIITGGFSQFVTGIGATYKF